MGTGTSPAALPANRPKSRRRVRIWLRRGLAGLAITVITLGGIGAVYQGLATRADRQTYPPPGEMVNIGGRRIHMLVMGRDTGQPAVILEGGMASFSSNFYWVQHELAATHRVVAYDRAGLGWSDPAPEPQDAYQSAQDLHAALVEAGISGPYVVAGHSYGGLVVRAFTDLYPEDVVGMVLIDASHPDQWAHIPASMDGKLNGRSSKVIAFLARFGVARLFQLEKSIYAGLPEQPAAEMRATLARPGSWQTSGDVILIWNDRTRPRINQASPLGNLPLGVISVTEQPVLANVLSSLQADLVTLSSNSIHHIEQGASHVSLVSEREHAMAVAETIRQVLEAASTGRPLSELAAQGIHDE